ncbi:hypothetical protein NC652_020080 [Populus alba x Populus x berolinensis]|nr:hypothetical protein NC652_020080 [Populus alba x Populus x berolinensis]
MAPGPSLAPAPAPGPGGPHHHFNGERQVKDFIETLLLYGGYNEMADILVNLTSLATEMGRLVSEGYVLTVLAPNDEAMAKLTTDQLSEPGAPEQIIYYHVIPEYQTEESMYNAVRRFGKISYDTLRLPHKVLAQEADGSVKFGHAENSAYLFDPDIYTDGRISVQGIDGVLFPLEEKEKSDTKTEMKSVKVAAKPQRRGKLLEVACRMLGTFGQDSHFTTCQNRSFRSIPCNRHCFISFLHDLDSFQAVQHVIVEVNLPAASSALLTSFKSSHIDKKARCELLRSCKVLVSEFSSLQIGSSFSHGKPTTKGEMGSWCDDVLIVFVLLKFHDCIGRKGSLSLVFEAL